MKRATESEQNAEEEADEEDTDETLAERIEEARGVLEKLEEIRRDSKDGKQTNEFFMKIIFLFSTFG